MQRSFDSLRDTRLETDGGRATLRDAFFDARTGALHYFAVDLGGWLETAEVVVAADRLTPPHQPDERWHLRITQDELQDAPQRNAGAAGDGLDLSDWPPLVVGPFGTTQAPLMLFAQAMVETGGTATEPPEAGQGDRAVRPFESAQHWMSLPAFDDRGEIGPVHDLMFDEGLNRLETVEIGTAEKTATAVTRLPLSALRYEARQRTHLVFQNAAAVREG